MESYHVNLFHVKQISYLYLNLDAVYKLELDDILEDSDFTLIGIYASLEDYRMAYLINQKLQIKLQRKTKDFQLNNSARFPIFEWEDKKQQKTWNLVTNEFSENLQNNNTGNLLFEETTNRTYMFPNNKKVTYLLKISETIKDSEKQKILSTITEIKQVVIAYDIPIEKIKNKDHYLFN